MFHHPRRRAAQAIFFLLSGLAFSFLASPAHAKGDEPSELYATASDGTPLHWTVYTPEGTEPWPAVLVIHPGCFVGGGPTIGPDMLNCSRDLADAGFIVFSIEYRLAP